MSGDPRGPPTYFTQSSCFSLAIRANSRGLFVTRTAPAAIAWPAIAVLLRLLGVLAAASAALISVVVSTAARPQASTASRLA